MLRLRADGTAPELDAFRRHNAPYIRTESKLYSTPKSGIYRRHYDLKVLSENPLILKDCACNTPQNDV